MSLNRREIQLFEGNRDHLDAVELAAGVPRTIADALGEELTEPHQTVASYGGTRPGSSMRHGHGSRKDEVDIDEERFFRAVDRSILEHHSRPSGMPLILAALAQYHKPFRRISRNPFLLEKGVEVDASSQPAYTSIAAEVQATSASVNSWSLTGTGSAESPPVLPVHDLAQRIDGLLLVEVECEAIMND